MCVLSHSFVLFIPAKCPSLDPPSNGAVEVTGLYQGSTATYSCVANYQLSNDETRTCGVNGMWSGLTPFCACKKEQKEIYIAEDYCILNFLQ